jgi:integrase
VGSRCRPFPVTLVLTILAPRRQKPVSRACVSTAPSVNPRRTRCLRRQVLANTGRDAASRTGWPRGSPNTSRRLSSSIGFSFPLRYFEVTSWRRTGPLSSRIFSATGRQMPNRLPRPLSGDQIERLFAQLRCERDRALLRPMLDGGLRPGLKRNCLAVNLTVSSEYAEKVSYYQVLILAGDK